MVLRAAARLALVATLCGALVAPRSAPVDEADGARLRRESTAEAYFWDCVAGGRYVRSGGADFPGPRDPARDAARAAAACWTCRARARSAGPSARRRALRHEVDADGRLARPRRPRSVPRSRGRQRRRSPRARFLEIIEGLDRRHVVVELPKLNDALVWASLLDGRTDRQVIESLEDSIAATEDLERGRATEDPRNRW
ncbi:hypothetical protein JL722_637 [Aureococcus anophagefferens]|nr:hypothetical protein JL722_637 [Aureococcus anophagefferens]